MKIGGSRAGTAAPNRRAQWDSWLERAAAHDDSALQFAQASPGYTDGYEGYQSTSGTVELVHSTEDSEDTGQEHDDPCTCSANPFEAHPHPPDTRFENRLTGGEDPTN